MLTCWVDDSEEQDREVFRRRMADGRRRARDAVGERFELLVCRECWRQVRREGLVYVEIPFADRIRMASVRNRRNPDVLLDLVRSHALLHLRQRPTERLEDGRLVVMAARADFDYAVRLFSDLHTTGGSLETKFDRNEDLVLSLAARKGVEQFTLRDLQQWTGWQYQKGRRAMVGHVQRGIRYPGLLDRSPALTMLDRTTDAIDEEGRDVRQRQLVFLFDGEVYRESRPSGQAWLEDGPEGDHHDDRWTGDDNGDERPDETTETNDAAAEREMEVSADDSILHVSSTGITGSRGTASPGSSVGALCCAGDE